MTPAPTTRAPNATAGRAAPLLLALLVAAGLLLALALWLPWEASEPREVSDAPAPTAELSAQPEPHAARRDALPAAAANDTATGAPTATPAPQPTPRDHFLIRVVDARTGAPVAGAEVAADAEDDLLLSAVEAQLLERTCERFARAARFGQLVVTDAHGRAALRGFGGLIAARKGDLLGQARVRPGSVGPDGYELRIGPMRHVVVRVRDGARQPLADMPIGLYSEQRYDELAEELTGTRLVGHTDAAGELRLTPELHLEHHAPLHRAELLVYAPGLTHVRQTWAAGQTEIDLTVAAYGTLRVRAVDANGVSLPDAPQWQVNVTNVDDASDADGVSCQLLGAGGGVAFTPVGLGARFEVALSMGDSRTDQTVAGPTGPGEATAVTIALGRPRFSARGRVRDASGQPLGGIELRVMDVPARFAGSTRTDADGRFLMCPGSEAAAAIMTVWLEARRGRLLIGRTAPFELNADVEYQAGELTLLPETTIARGTLVEERPRPAGLRLLVLERADELWRQANDYVVRTDDTPDFTVVRLGPPRPHPLRLRVYAPGCEPVPPLDLPLGADLRIVLRPGGRCVARVVLDPAVTRFIASSELDLVLTGADGREAWMRPELRGGEFWFADHSCPTGTFTAHLEPGNASLNLGQIEGVRIAPDTPPDPRLMPWDLRTAVQLLTVRVLDAAGQPLGVEGYVDLRWPDHDWSDFASLNAGTARGLAPRRPVDMLVQVDGRGCFTRRQVEGDQVFVLPQPKRVRVRCVGMPALAERDGLEARLEPQPAWLQSQGLPEYASPIGDVQFDREKGEFTAIVEQPVEARLWFGVRDASTPLATEPVTLAPEVGEVTVTLAAATRAALAPFARR